MTGAVISGDDENPTIHQVSTDSRINTPNSLFIALKGETHDGHTKLAEAHSNGALAAVVEHLPSSIPNLPLIQVPNTRIAMGQLATHARKQLTGTVIAIGGSNGKTSTKYLLHSVLKTQLKGSISPKSFNNDIGVPLAIFPAKESDDYLVLEIGTNHPGEVKSLSELAQPDVAIITSIGAEHLEGLGDLEGVRREEAAIIAGLKPTGTLIVNGDDEKLLALVSAFPGTTITFGLKDHNNLRATNIDCTETGVAFTLNDCNKRIFIPQLGKHVASNALAVIAAARHMSMKDEAIIAALSRAHAPEMRLQIEKVQGLTLINDAYNANPASTRAALETLAALPAEKRRIAVLGDMRELGPQTDHYHKETGTFAAHSNLDVLICVGPNAKLIAQAAQEAGMPSQNIHQFPDSPAAVRSVPRTLRKGDLVLFKASRTVQLETVVNAVIKQRQPREEKIAS
jgi:UDP-N-acetylmuramoyl-tripeptide--D-alanyl-D-alanine ligase